MDERLRDTKTMANQLDIHARTLREWVARGVVPVIKINSRTWRFDVSSVREALKARSQPEQTE